MKNTIIALAASAIALGSVNAQLSFITPSEFGLTSQQVAPFSSSGVSSNGVAWTLTSSSTGDGGSIGGAFSAIQNGILADATLSNTAPGTVSWTLSFSSATDVLIEDFTIVAPEVVTVTSTSGGVTSSPFVDTSVGGDHTAYTAVGVTDITYTYSRPNQDGSVEGRQAFTVQVGQSAVPEPSSALLLGFSALGFLGRRKR